jgi:hypothetical protein
MLDRLDRLRWWCISVDPLERAIKTLVLMEGQTRCYDDRILAATRPLTPLWCLQKNWPDSFIRTFAIDTSQEPKKNIDPRMQDPLQP